MHALREPDPKNGFLPGTIAARGLGILEINSLMADHIKIEVSVLKVLGANTLDKVHVRHAPALGTFQIEMYHHVFISLRIFPQCRPVFFRR